MRQFHFRLEGILRWQARIQTTQKERLTQLLHQLQVVEARIDELQVNSSDAAADVFSQVLLQARDLEALNAFRVDISRQIGVLSIESKARESEVDRQRALYVAERRRVRMLEAMKARDMAEHVRAIDRELESLATESFLSRWSAGDHEDSATPDSEEIPEI